MPSQKPHPELPPRCSCIKLDHNPRTGGCRCAVFAPLMKTYLWQLGEWDMYAIASIMAREWRAAKLQESEARALEWEAWGPRPATATDPDAVEFKTP